MVPGEVMLELKGNKLHVGSVVEIRTDRQLTLASIEKLDPVQKIITVAYGRSHYEEIPVDKFEEWCERAIPISELVDAVNSARSI